VVIEKVEDQQSMVDRACQIVVNEGLGEPGDRIVIAAGVPFGTAGTTNLLRVARIPIKRKRKRPKTQVQSEIA
ncbi:MAG: hypothetical protein HOI95_08410, partial [Chromatiales bacterium]|nr:hypothetical protein [Chromatiales bacterium]